MTARICTERGAALTELLWVATLLACIALAVALVSHRGLQALAHVVGWIEE